MIAERKNEPPGSVLAVSAPPLSFSLSFFFSVCENLHRAEPLSAEASVPRHNRCFVFAPVNTHPSSTGRLCLPGEEKHGATAPILIHIAAPG